MEVDENDQATHSAPLGHINIHIRSGSIILTHTKSAYSLTETRKGSYSLIVNLDDRGMAEGDAILDDGLSPECTLNFSTFDLDLGCASIV